MSNALALLEALEERGVEVVSGLEVVRFRPACLVRSEELECFQELKSELLILLCVQDRTMEVLCSALSSEDAQALREERAAILEYEGGMCREGAESWAFGQNPGDDRFRQKDSEAGVALY